MYQCHKMWNVMSLNPCLYTYANWNEYGAPYLGIICDTTFPLKYKGYGMNDPSVLGAVHILHTKICANIVQYLKCNVRKRQKHFMLNRSTVQCILKLDNLLWEHTKWTIWLSALRIVFLFLFFFHLLFAVSINYDLSIW